MKLAKHIVWFTGQVLKHSRVPLNERDQRYQRRTDRMRRYKDALNTKCEDQRKEWLGSH